MVELPWIKRSRLPRLQKHLGCDGNRRLKTPCTRTRGTHQYQLSPKKPWKMKQWNYKYFTTTRLASKLLQIVGPKLDNSYNRYKLWMELSTPMFIGWNKPSETHCFSAIGVITPFGNKTKCNGNPWKLTYLLKINGRFRWHFLWKWSSFSGD